MSYTLSPGQAEALKQIGYWYKNKTAPFVTLGGYAGTGKTTLIAYLRQALRQHDEDSKVAFCAFTGKATRVLSEQLKQHKVPRRGDSVTTIHSLIYTAESRPGGQVEWKLKDSLAMDLIIADEASMIDQTIWNDLLSFGVPILAVGDHGQLPPVGSSFNLMAEPVLKLEQIFRQAETSPIIELATMARTTGHIPVGEYGALVKKLSRSDPETGQIVQDVLEANPTDQLVLCGYNHTRQKLNQAVRGYMGFETPLPTSGDRVVCLRNNRQSKLYNGMTGSIFHLTNADDDPDQLWHKATINLDNEDYAYEGYILRSQFGELETVKAYPQAPGGIKGDLFDFGYALTVHKAQGSQARRVLLFEERFSKSSEADWRRWLYTAVTRAMEELIIVGE